MMLLSNAIISSIVSQVMAKSWKCDVLSGNCRDGRGVLSIPTTHTWDYPTSSVFLIRHANPFPLDEGWMIATRPGGVDLGLSQDPAWAAPEPNQWMWPEPPGVSFLPQAQESETRSEAVQEGEKGSNGNSSTETLLRTPETILTIGRRKSDCD